MKFTCTKDHLAHAIGQVSPIAGRNNQLPALQHVLLQAREGGLQLTTTDLEVGVQTAVGGKVDGEGGCTIPARSFQEYIQQLPNTNPIAIEQKNDGVVVTTEGFRARFAPGDAEDFPLLPERGDTKSLEVPGQTFAQALSRVMFAAARDETRPEIRSVYIQGEEGGLRIAATDSFRLAEEVVPLDASKEMRILLPLPAAQEVVRLFGDTETIHIAPQENHVLFQGGGVELSSRLINGQYPDYQQIIPNSHSVSMTLPREELLRALKTLAVFLPRDTRRVELDIAPGSNKLIARVAGSETGQGDVSLDLESGEGADVQVLVNIQYLMEGMQHIPAEMCVAQLSGPQDPIVFQPASENDDQGRYMYVVMPIQAQ